MSYGAENAETYNILTLLSVIGLCCFQGYANYFTL